MLPRAQPTVIFQKLDDGAVLFAPESELYFGLNSVGARIWELLTRGDSFDEICAGVSTAYPEVDGSTIRTDVLELFEQLVREGLAVLPSPGGDAVHAP